jgi:hypothetical protein
MGLEAGFIGCWGEWHSSWYQGDQDIPPKTAIVRGLVEAFTWPHDAALDPHPAWQSLLYAPQIAIRYPSLVRAVATQLTQAEQARVGHHNDCFLASTDDSGTWGRGPQPLSIADDKAYVSTLGRNHIVGGETCAYPGRVACNTALAELAAMHFTYLNDDFHPDALQAFKDGGCFDEINRRLGYRLWVKTADFPTAPPQAARSNFGSLCKTTGLRRRCTIGLSTWSSTRGADSHTRSPCPPWHRPRGSPERPRFRFPSLSRQIFPRASIALRFGSLTRRSISSLEPNTQSDSLMLQPPLSPGTPSKVTTFSSRHF